MPLKRNKTNGEILGMRDGRVEGSFISFVRYPALEKGVTQFWCIINGRDVIAEVRWFTNWRKYSFYPGSETVFEEVCLGEIADFCVELTKFHRTDRKQQKAKGAR